MPDLRVLLIEDEDAYAAAVRAELAACSVQLQRAPSIHAARKLVPQGPLDAVLLDLNLPDSGGLETVDAVRRLVEDTPIVVLTGTADEQMSIAAVQRGADDYLFKHETDGPVLLRSIRYAVERAALRRSMRESEARFRAMVEHGSDAITLLDASGTILFDTQSITRVMGYTPEERLGQPTEAYIHPDDAPQMRAALQYLLDHPDETVRTQYRFRHKDGSWRWGEGTAVNQLAMPAVRGIVINHRDVHDSKMMEEALQRSEAELRQAQKMEAVGRLAGGVAHDFNNVLTAIFGYTDLLVTQFGVDDPRRADVVEIRRAAERAAALTRQLLAFSRKQVLEARTLNLNVIVASIERLLARLVGENVELELDLDPDLGAVRADPGQIEQVLMNLAANARDAMPNGGRLTIATRNQTVAEETSARPGLKRGTYAVLSVRDSGEGIPQHVREHIFEPFFTTKEQGKGTGLGLATVYGVVKQSGGSVYLESEEGRGTTFLVYLPWLKGQ